MRLQALSRVLVAASAILAAACGGRSSPLSATATTRIASGTQTLRVTFQAPCPNVNDNTITLLPLVYVRVQVRQEGDEWVATAGGAGGDVDLRFRQTGSSPNGIMMLAGSIAGTARHMPELVPTLPAWEASMNFGRDRQTTVNGVAFAISGTPNAGVDGTGSGAVTLTNSTGVSCGASSFSWTLAPQ
jgi:hypothetical protein